MVEIGLWVTYTDQFWMASRGMDSRAESAWFVVMHGPRETYPNYNGLYLIQSNGYNVGATQEFGLRPVITLDDDIQIESGGGGAGNAFKLVAKQNQE